MTDLDLAWQLIHRWAVIGLVCGFTIGLVAEGGWAAWAAESCLGLTAGACIGWLVVRWREVD